MSTEIYKILPTTMGYHAKDEPVSAHIKLRPYEADDAKFILHSWLKSMRGMYRDARDEHYYEGVQARILRLSQQEQTRVIIACDSEKPWYIYGYMVADIPENEDAPLIIHYVFVKNSFRRQGIGMALLESFGWHRGRPVQATHWNYYLKDIKAIVKMHYNPWLLDPK